MSVVGTIALTAVGVQLAATMLLQRTGIAWMRWPDSLGLLPVWRFFAFGDLETEWRLAVRDGDGTAPLGPWRAARIWPVRRWSHAVWTPHAIAGGLTSDAMETLAARAARDAGIEPASSRAYTRLLARALAEPGAARGATTRQFALLRVRHPTPPEPVFTSRFHALPDEKT